MYRNLKNSNEYYNDQKVVPYSFTLCVKDNRLFETFSLLIALAILKRKVE